VSFASQNSSITIFLLIETDYEIDQLKRRLRGEADDLYCTVRSSEEMSRRRLVEDTVSAIIELGSS
jgi:hypothetical protein